MRKRLNPSGEIAGMILIFPKATTMTNNSDPELENSTLSRDVTRDGITVKVQIYRMRGVQGGWSLEVVDHEGTSTVWDDLFATDKEAFEEFERTIAADGFSTFLDGPGSAA